MASGEMLSSYQQEIQAERIGMQWRREHCGSNAVDDRHRRIGQGSKVE
jgi:hypothetical protein